MTGKLPPGRPRGTPRARRAGTNGKVPPGHGFIAETGEGRWVASWPDKTGTWHRQTVDRRDRAYGLVATHTGREPVVMPTPRRGEPFRPALPRSEGEVRRTRRGQR